MIARRGSPIRDAGPTEAAPGREEDREGENDGGPVEEGLKRHIIRCYVNQRLSPMIVARDMAAYGLLDTSTSQQWFIDQCFEADFVASSCSKTLGDAQYFKKLLHKVAKELSRDGRVMEDAVAEAMGAVDGLAADLEQEVPESKEWLHKSYFYGRQDEEMHAVVRIGSHVNMFAGSTVRKEEATRCLPRCTGMLTWIRNTRQGCFEWDAGYLLCEFILNNVSLFQGRTVVELGCGTGMATIMLARLQRDGILACGPVVCTDGDQETIDNCKMNLLANGMKTDEESSNVFCDTWVWEDGYKGLDERRRCLLETGSPVTMIGADLLYDPEIIPIIVPLIVEFLDNVHPDSRVYLSTRRRSEATLDKFLRAVDAVPTLVLEDVSASFWEASRSDLSFVSFQHVPSLEDAKRNKSIILHCLWKA